MTMHFGSVSINASVVYFWRGISNKWAGRNLSARQDFENSLKLNWSIRNPDRPLLELRDLTMVALGRSVTTSSNEWTSLRNQALFYVLSGRLESFKRLLAERLARVHHNHNASFGPQGGDATVFYDNEWNVLSAEEDLEFLRGMVVGKTRGVEDQ